MRTNIGNQTKSFTKALVRTAVALAAGLLITTGARAESATIIAVENPALVSSFTLNFTGFGVTTSGLIASTDIAFEVDPDQGTARFVQYFQHVAALTLPGGFDTGDLIIEIVDGSSFGTYNELTKEFNTEELYVIHFTGDLSAFGIESPVILPSTSRGFVTIGTESGGEINLSWEGDGVLANPNPNDPNPFIEFEYTCDVATTFTAAPVNRVRLALVPEVINLDLRKGVEHNLVAKLMAAVDGLNRNRDFMASNMLNAFNSTVSALSGRQILLEDADQLITGSNNIIDSITNNVSASTQLTPLTVQTRSLFRRGAK